MELEPERGSTHGHPSVPPGPGAAAPEKVIVCFGDSTAEDAPADERQRWPARLHTRFSAAGAGNYRVINAEASGLATGQALSRIEPGVVFHRPHLVTLRFGCSDSRSVGGAPATSLSRFEANLRAIAQLIRERTGGIIVFVTSPHSLRLSPGDVPDPPSAYREVTYRVAYELNAPLLDLDVELRQTRVRAAGLLSAGGQPLQAWVPEFYAESAFRFLKRLL